MADPADAKTYAQPRVIAAGLDWPTYDRQITVESNWRQWSSPGVVLSSPTGSKGLGQLNERYYPETVWSDPYRNIDASIATDAANLKRFGSYRKALAAYNWGPGNVGGYTDESGRVHPAWDGTREWRCPIGLPQCATAQRDHYLDLILGPGWPEPTKAAPPAPSTIDTGGDPDAGAPVASPSLAVPWTRTQLITAGFSTPAEWPIASPRPIQAIVWHDMEGHLAGAIATWNQGAAGAHLCVLEDGTIVRTCLIENIAWHAGTNNDPNGGVYGRTPFWRSHNINPYSIGVELEGFVTSGYTQAQLDACVKIGAWAHAQYGIAPVHTVDQIPGHHLHSELSSSRSDPGPKFPFDTILQRSAQGGRTVPDPVSAYAVGAGLLAAMQANGDSPASDELYFKRGEKDEWSEAFGASGTRYVYVAALNRVHRFEPAA